jgi:hypothetical protein
MRRRIVPALAGVLALLLTSSAAHASQGIEVGREAVEQTLTSSAVTFRAESFTVRCPLTLRGEIDEVTPKVVGVVGGAILEAAVGTCEGGTGSFLAASLPWDLEYASFTGTLPSITGVRYEVPGVSDQATVLGVRCLYEGTLRGTLNGTRVTQLSISEGTLSLKEGTFCPTTETVSGTLSTSAAMTLALYAGENGGTGRFVANPTSLAFGRKAVDSENSLSTSLENSFADRNIHIRRIVVNGSNRFTTAITLGPGEQLRIRANSASSFGIRFRPTAPGNYSATVELFGASNVTPILQIPVSGEA